MALAQILTDWRVAFEHGGAAGVVPKGAEEQLIAAAEQRLGVRLPKSYRAFLAMHNGWPVPDESIGSLLPVERIFALGDEETGSLAMLMDPRAAVSERKRATWVQEHRGRLVQIAEYADGYLLLDTSRPTAEEECEVCFVAAWIPGTKRYRTFGAFMKRQWEAYAAAHPSIGEGAPGRSKRLNLRRPPELEDEIREPKQFVAELIRLGWFQYANEASQERATAEYLKRCAQCQGSGMLPVGRWSARAVPLLEPEIGRCVWLAQATLLERRAVYAVGELAKLLARMGVVLPTLVEEMTESSYAAKLGDVRQMFFKLRNGMPARSGGSQPQNAASWYACESAKLVTMYLKAIGSEHRIAIVDIASGEPEGEIEHGLVCMTDELSYLMAWAPAIGNECRPLRPDVWT